MMASGVGTVQVWRIFSDAEGKSHMEPIEVPLEPRENGRGGLSRLYGGSGVIFRRTPPDVNVDWHVAPRRQLIVNLSGEGEIETSDGAVLILKAGVIELVEDLTGQGHRTRGRGTE
jgi:hypothetical protein